MYDTRLSITVRYGLISCLFLTGCYGPAGVPVIVPSQAGPPYVLPLEHRTIGMSVENRPIECLFVGSGAEATFILAAIHGDEPAGTVLAERLTDHLRRHPQLLTQRKVILLPVANPDGLVGKSRFNANGVDLNRNFATDKRTNDKLCGPAPLSEPEALAIAKTIHAHKPCRIVSIHQMTDTGPEGLAARLPKGCIDHDGPAEALADHIAKYCDLPVAKLGAQPGSLGSYAGLASNIPIITLELPVGAHLLDSQSLWNRYGPTLLAAVAFPAAPQ